MKKHTFRTALVLLVILAMIVPCLPVVASAADPTIETRTAEAADKAWYDEHTSDTTLYIGSTGELAYFMELGAQATAVTFEGKTIQLTADIVWNYGEATADGFTPDTGAQGNVIYDWTPYGKNDSTNSFQGTFDGNGHKISGLYTSSSVKNDGGFIRYTGEGASIQNVSFENMYVFESTDNVGALVGQPKAALTISNVKIQGYIVGESYIGGLVAQSATAVALTVSNVNVDIAIVGKSYIGGLVARQFGDLTVSDTNVRVNIEGSSYVGGLVGAANTGANTISASRCSVSGSIITASGAQATGGFVGNQRNYTVSISDSVCYADITAGMYGGGFVGASAGKLTLTGCYYLGTMSLRDGNSNYSASQGAFASLLRNTTYNLAQASNNTDTDPKNLAEIGLTDCYFAPNSAMYAMAVSTATPGYKVTVSYADGTAGTYNCTTESDKYSSQKNAAMTNLFKTVSLAAKDTDVVANNGVQLRNNGSTFDARFVSTIDFDETLTKSNISEVGIEIAILNEFAAGTAEAVKTKSCDKVYKSIKSSYGMGTITAGEGDYTDVDYLATLVVTGIPTSGTQTFVIRTYCKVGETYHYGSYAAVTFINGAFAASKTVATA